MNIYVNIFTYICIYICIYIYIYLYIYIYIFVCVFPPRSLTANTQTVACQDRGNTRQGNCLQPELAHEAQACQTKSEQ